MENLKQNPEKHIATPEEKQELQRALGQYGLVDATLFDYPTTEHPEDEQWIIPSTN